MTWKEFKEMVEAWLKEHGYDEDISIDYIDIVGGDVKVWMGFFGLCIED